MSVQYCHACDKNIDTDNDAEHFEMHFNESVETHLKGSENFDEFYQNADAEIAEHLLQTTGQEPLSEVVEAFAKDVWDEYITGELPF